MGNNGIAIKVTKAIAKWRFELPSLKFSLCDIFELPTR